MKQLLKIMQLALLLTLTTNLFSQEVKITTDYGFAGYGNPVDGYAFSFDVGIPLFKSVEIDPSFSFYSNVKNGEIDYFWNKNELSTTIDEKVSGKMAADMLLYINVNPFVWFNNSKLNNVDFGIGVGYGLKVFSNYHYEYENKVTSIITKAGIASSLSAKLYYNYHIKNYFIGAMIGVKELNDEGVSIISFRFGIKLNNAKE